MPPLFTIIIAGYQCEPYLPKCLASVANQTYGDFEAICQEWAKRDHRFTVATGPKSGSASTTRNYGIDHATGEYLVVVDGDDWVAPDMLEKLSNKLNETGPLDILAFAGTKVTEENSENITSSVKNQLSNFTETDARPSQIFSGLEAFRRMKAKDNSAVSTQTGLCIYRVAFLRENHLRQIEGMTTEDLEWFPRTFFAARKVAYVNECFYFYRQNPNSLQHRQFIKCFYDFSLHFQHLITFIKEHPIPPDIQSIWSNQWLWLYFNFIFYWFQTSAEDQKANLKIFFSTRPKILFWRFLLSAAWHRTVALPLLWLASNGWFFPANFYFRKIYLPLDWRCRYRYAEKSKH